MDLQKSAKLSESPTSASQSKWIHSRKLGWAIFQWQFSEGEFTSRNYLKGNSLETIFKKGRYFPDTTKYTLEKVA